ncbi:MAG: SRPBCC domain-containing protein [Ferruginibacter sp.]
MQKAIKQTWQFAQSPEEVWDYLTQPALIEQWLMKNDFQPIVGHKFRFSFSPKPESKYTGGVDCEVLTATPFTKLSYTWNGTTSDNRTFSSVVEWTLIPTAGGTELQLLHDGFEMLEDLLTHENGWKGCLARFENAINSVKP